MAKLFTLWPDCPGFCNINLRTPGSFVRCLLMAVTKFQDKFASLWKVNRSNSQDKFQICCTDMYFENFKQISRYYACFCQFHRISWIHLTFTALRPHEISEALLLLLINS